MLLAILILWFLWRLVQITFYVMLWSLIAAGWILRTAFRAVRWYWRACRRRRPRRAAMGNTTTEQEHAPLSLLPTDERRPEERGPSDRG